MYPKKMKIENEIQDKQKQRRAQSSNRDKSYNWQKPVYVFTVVKSDMSKMVKHKQKRWGYKLAYT